MRYTVMDPSGGTQPVTRFVTEAITNPLSAQITRALINFDLIQLHPGVQYDNVELDFFGDWLLPGQVLQWYANESGPGIPAWGVSPLIRRFPAGMFPEMPGRGGIEATWVDRFYPYPFNQMYHFGLVLDPAAMGPIPQAWTWVQAYWTQIIKYPIPVPWQFWQAAPGLAVRDIVRYGGEEVGPITLTRQYVSLSTRIPLEDLMWDTVDPLPWLTVPGDPITMMPNENTIFDLPVRDGDQAALVRYIAQAPDGRQSRVINEALIRVDATQVPDGQNRGDLYLAPSRPNPATSSAEINFRLPEASPVRISVTDAAGRQVAVLQDGSLPAGSHTICWNGLTKEGTPAPPGVYFYTLTAGSRSMTQRLVLER